MVTGRTRKSRQSTPGILARASSQQTDLDRQHRARNRSSRCGTWSGDQRNSSENLSALKHLKLFDQVGETRSEASAVIADKTKEPPGKGSCFRSSFWVHNGCGEVEVHTGHAHQSFCSYSKAIRLLDVFHNIYWAINCHKSEDWSNTKALFMNASSRCSWTLKCQLAERSIYGIACGEVNGLNSIVCLQLLPWDLLHGQRWRCLQTQKTSLISTRGENGEIKNYRSFSHGCKGSGCRIPTKSTDLQHSRGGQVEMWNLWRLSFISETMINMDKQGKDKDSHGDSHKSSCLSPRIQLMSCSQSGGLARTLSLKMRLIRWWFWCNVTQVCRW